MKMSLSLESLIYRYLEKSPFYCYRFLVPESPISVITNTTRINTNVFPYSPMIKESRESHYLRKRQKIAREQSKESMIYLLSYGEREKYIQRFLSNLGRYSRLTAYQSCAKYCVFRMENREFCLWDKDFSYPLVGLINLTEAKAVILFPDSFLKVNKSIRTLFYLLLAELFWQNKLLLIHAGCLVKDRQGMLVVGPRAAGKSTSVLALLRGGFDFISDDLTLLKRDSHGIFKALGIPEEIRLRKKTLSFFPELKSRATSSIGKKRCFRIEEIYPGRLKDTCSVDFICLPVSRDNERFDNNYLSPREAMEMLLPTVNLAFPPRPGIVNDKLRFISDLVCSTRNFYISRRHSPSKILARVSRMMETSGGNIK